MSAEAIAEARALLASAGIDPVEVDELAAVSSADDTRLLDLARRRVAGAPLGALTGRQRFLGLELLTAPGVLVPRPWTELLAEAAIELLRAADSSSPELRLVDACCGAGNLACAIAASVPRVRAWATDLTAPSVELARRNVARLGLGDRVEVLQGDLLEPLAGLGLQGTIDALVCNPPYISTGRLERDRAMLLEHEPREAFDGGPYGLSIHQRVAREAAAFLAPGAPLLMEIGEGQERQVALLLGRAGAWTATEVRKDSAGTPRVVVTRRKVG